MTSLSSGQVLHLLRAYESPNVTYLDPAGDWPIVWTKAKGVHVWDLEGRKYLDLTAAFGVANAGHANPRVIQAARTQMSHLLHAMGDVHPHPLKAQLLQRLSALTFERWTKSSTRPCHGRTVLGNSGFESVEAALKTALLATGKPGIAAFTGGYHGLGYGTLNTTERDLFRQPFLSQLRQFGHFLPYPTQPADLEPLHQQLDQLLTAQARPVGAVLVEPVQGRGGIQVPPPDFLPLLRKIADEHRILLIVDEVFTGFGRTGRWFAVEHSSTVPDLICLGKALTGGFPLSACVGRADLMERAWPLSTGEAIHTSTFLGHPIGCAMALAQLDELQSRNLIPHAADLGSQTLLDLQQQTAVFPNQMLKVRGTGLMIGLELGMPAPEHTDAVPRLCKQLLSDGIIALPEGPRGNVLSLTPPLTIRPRQWNQALDRIFARLQQLT